MSLEISAPIPSDRWIGVALRLESPLGSFVHKRAVLWSRSAEPCSSLSWPEGGDHSQCKSTFRSQPRAPATELWSKIRDYRLWQLEPGEAIRNKTVSDSKGLWPPPGQQVSPIVILVKARETAV